MGFSVVADEVRNLAHRSALAARETATSIEDSIKKSQRGVQLSQQVTGSLQEIVTKVRKMDELASQVASASKEQSQGINELNAAMVSMDRSTQDDAGRSEEGASVAKAMSAEATALGNVVKHLGVFMEGSMKVSETTPSNSKHIPTQSGSPRIKAVQNDRVTRSTQEQTTTGKHY